MKSRNKLLSLLLLVVLTLLLVSCSRTKPGETTNIATFVVDGMTEEVTGQTIVEEFPSESDFKLDFTSWIVLENGSVEKQNIRDGKLVVEDGAKADKRGIRIALDRETPVITEGNVRTYTLIYSDTSGNTAKTKFKQYKIDNINTDAIGYAVNYDERTLHHNQGYSFDGSGLKVNLINGDGTYELLSTEQLDFQGDDYHPRNGEDGKSFVNFVNRTVSLSIKGTTANPNLYEDLGITTINVRVAGGRAPIHAKTSSFWNWIFLQTPMAYIASFFGKITGGSLAWAIVFTTITIRTLAWPIYAKTNDMSMKMALAQPDMNKIQEKYATRKDQESQQKMQMELMGVYKKHNINMFGCLLPILQMPIFLAMFQVVSRIAIPGGQFAHNVTHTQLFGIELSDAAGISWVNFLLATIVGTTMFLLQKISAKKPSYAKEVPQTGDKQAQSEQTMKMVSYFMIFMMVFASFSQRSLAFYWVIGNLFSIGQTLFNKYLNEKKYERMEEEKLYGKGNRPRGKVIDAKFRSKGEKK